MCTDLVGTSRDQMNLQKRQAVLKSERTVRRMDFCRTLSRLFKNFYAVCLFIFQKPAVNLLFFTNLAFDDTLVKFSHASFCSASPNSLAA